MGAFGTSGTPGIIPITTWNTSDIWLRRTFTVPAGTNANNLKFELYHDDDVQIYLNGILAYSATGFITSYQIADINPAALALLTPGANITMAVHCYQTIGGQGVDVGIVSRVPIVSAVPETQIPGISSGSGVNTALPVLPGRNSWT